MFNVNSLFAGIAIADELSRSFTSRGKWELRARARKVKAAIESRLILATEG